MRLLLYAILAILVSAGITLVIDAINPIPPRRKEFVRAPDYPIAREPYPTIQADTIGVGNVIGVERKSTDGMTPVVYPVRVREVRRVGDYVILEHFDPQGCPIGVHGGECLTATDYLASERVRFFPAESA